MISYHHFLAMGIYTGWYHDETTDCAGLAQELDYLSQLYGLYTAVGTLSPSVLGAEHPQRFFPDFSCNLTGNACRKTTWKTLNNQRRY